MGGGANAAGIVNNDFTNLTYGLDLNGEKHTAGGIVYSYPMTKCNITNNMFIVEGCGIWLGNEPCYANKITNNTIAVGGTDGWGIAVWISYNDKFTNNRISGYGAGAVAVEGYDNTASSHNEYFKGNSVKNFIASWCDYYMNSYTHDNTAIGICSENATYVDYGVNNHFMCLSLANPVAPAMKAFSLSKSNRLVMNPVMN